jgi:hypothetical protein
MERGRQERHLGGLVEKERKRQAWRRYEIGRKSGIRMVYLDSSHLLYQKKKIPHIYNLFHSNPKSLIYYSLSNYLPITSFFFLFLSKVNGTYCHCH